MRKWIIKWRGMRWGLTDRPKDGVPLPTAESAVERWREHAGYMTGGNAYGGWARVHIKPDCVPDCVTGVWLC